MRAAAMAIAIGISLAGCVTSESEYVDAVRVVRFDHDDGAMVNVEVT